MCLMRLMAESSKPVLPGSAKNSSGSDADDGVVGDDFGGSEVALEVRILHELDVAETGEAFAADGIAGRVDADFGIDAGEVVDGVGVLAAGEATDGDPAGIAIVFPGVGGEFGANPGDGLLALRVARLRHAFWRHAVLLEYGCDFSPGLKALADGGLRGQLLQAYTSHGCCRGCNSAVALKAILLEYQRRVGRRFVRAAKGAGDEDGNDCAATEQERSLAPVGPFC